MRRPARAHARARAARRGFCTIEFPAGTDEPGGPPHRPVRSIRDGTSEPTQTCRPRSARSPLPARPLVHRPADYLKTVTAPLTPLSTSPRRSCHSARLIFLEPECLTMSTKSSRRSAVHARTRATPPCTRFFHERFPPWHVRTQARASPLDPENARTIVWSAPFPQGLVGVARSRRRECIRPLGMRLACLGPLWDQRAAGLVIRAASRADSFDRLLRRRSTVVAMSSLAEQNSCALPGRRPQAGAR